VNSSKEKHETTGTKHWLFQVIPPLLMLCILFATESGTSLVFLAGIFIIPVFISLISIIAKLIFFKKRKCYLVRPVLTVAVFFLILSIAHWTYNVALGQAINAAKIIHQQCNENSVCPVNPVDWKVDDLRIRRNDLGYWLTYSASYYYNKETFNIRVYKGSDSGDIITGGVNIPLKVEPYVER
jgi:hypothetical protein